MRTVEFVVELGRWDEKVDWCAFRLDPHGVRSLLYQVTSGIAVKLALLAQEV